MIEHRVLQSRIRVVMGLTTAALTVLAGSAASAQPEPQVLQLAQAGEAAEPPAAAKPRPRKPIHKPTAHAASKADTPPATTPPAPAVAPTAAPSPAPAQATQPAQLAPAAQTAQPAAAIVTEPMRHAQEARLARCAETVSRASSSTIDTAHAAVSTWSQKGPDEHMFQSIVALTYSNKIAPKAAAVLVAAPEGTGCEATTVQVYPTTRSCSDVEGDLKKAGRNVGDFGGVAMTQEQGASRHLLLPAPGTGCVVVAVGLALNQ